MHMHVQGHARNQIPPGGSKTDFTEPEHHGKGPVSLQIQRGGRGRDHPSLQGRCGSVAQCVRPVLYEIQSPVEPMQDGGDIPFSSFFLLFSRWIHHIYFVLRLRWRGFVRRTINDCDFDSGSSVAGLERGGDSTIQMSCCRL